MTETYKNQIVQHIIKNLLDIQLLRIIQAEPTWGYKIKKNIEKEFNIKIRHSALYPTLGMLKKKGFISCELQQKNGRARIVYSITENGSTYLQTYYKIMQGHKIADS